MCGCNKYKAAVVAPQLAISTTFASAPASASASAPASAPAPAGLPTVDPLIWGPPLWSALHIAAYASVSRGLLPRWQRLLTELRTGLPCPECSAHYNSWFNSHPLRTTLLPPNNTQQSIIRFVQDLHNSVNVRNNKPTWSTAQSARVYGGNQIALAKTNLDSVQGMIGQGVYNALLGILNAV
jgi:hypothetical protein